MLAGRWGSSRLASRHFQRGFSIVLVIVATGLLAKLALNI
jgi:hypothetical protein